MATVPPPPPSSVRHHQTQRKRPAKSHHHLDSSSSFSSSSACIDERKRSSTTTKATSTSTSTSAPYPAGAKAGTTTTVGRRPLGTTRGRNDGRFAFEKRNSRDVIGGRGRDVIPPTRSDVALLAMLDGKTKKTTTTTKKRCGRDGIAAGGGGGENGRRDKRPRRTTDAAGWNDVGDDGDDDDDDDELVVLMPPPPPSLLPPSRYRPPPPPRGNDFDDRGGGRRMAGGARANTGIGIDRLEDDVSRHSNGTDIASSSSLRKSKAAPSAYALGEEKVPDDANTAADGGEGGDVRHVGSTIAATAAISLPLMTFGGAGGMRRKGGGRSSSMFHRRDVDGGRRTTAGSSSGVVHHENHHDEGESHPINASIANDDDRLEHSSSRMFATTIRGRASSSSSDATSDVVVVEATRARSGDINPDGDEVIETRNHADWYDPDEFARMEMNASSSVNDDDADANAVGDARVKKSRTGAGGRGGSSTGINDNFVRLDMRNSAGSCRGARNLKRVNKHKLWRAQHRFGMNDTQPRDRAGGTTNDGDDDVDGDGGGISGSIYRGKERTRFNSTGKVDGGDLKCFSSATNAGVDPLDDFVDGTYSSTKKKNVKRVDASAPRTRDESVPNCTRHQRPCKLLTVKRNNKGNKGRKFYVCCMPKGEQCDYFKWEEDTLEAAQRALLESSSNSGFIARQVAAAKLRFRELTVPELRVEAKGRGIKATGKKSEILTRLLIWVRDEIADSVESSSPGQETPSSSESKAIADDIVDDDDDSADDSDDDNESTEIAPFTTKMIELSDDDSSTDYSSDVEDTDDCELEICREVSGPTRPISSTIQSANTLHDSLENYFGYTEFRDGQEWAIRRVLAHERTLLVAPTGQGKSLCYALPAAIMDGICLVVSPLISLMQDQLRQLPPKIPAATLSGSMTVAKMALIVDDVMRNRYKVLFVSPERLASAAFRRLVRPKFNVETQKFERQFPVVSLLCVDEVSFFCFLLHLIYHVMLTPRLLENDDIRHIA